MEPTGLLEVLVGNPMHIRRLLGILHRRAQARGVDPLLTKMFGDGFVPLIPVAQSDLVSELELE